MFGAWDPLFYPDDPPPCVRLQTFLQWLDSGTLPCLMPWHTRSGLEHWRKCDECQRSLPDGEHQLQFCQRRIEQDLAIELGEQRHEFLATRHTIEGQLLTANDYEARQLRAAIVSLLREHAGTIRESLEYVNDVAGLASFTLFPAKDSEEVYAFQSAAPFLHSLERETQEFVFLCLATGDLMSAGVPTADLTPPPPDAEHSVEQVGAIAFNPEVLLEVLNRAVPGIRDSYFKTNPSIIPDKPPPADNLDNVMVAGLKRAVEGIDSLMAGHMEVLRLLPRRREEYRQRICERLGSEVAERLCSRTIALLADAEHIFDTGGNESHVVHALAAAVETEFTEHFLRPAVATLTTSAGQDYRSGKERLIERGQLNPRLTFGQKLWCARNDPAVRSVLEERGLTSANLEPLAGLLDLRNRAAHNWNVTREEAERLREEILGASGIFQLLYPPRNQGS